MSGEGRGGGKGRKGDPGASGALTQPPITVSVPLPTVLLTLNQRMHWRTRARHSKEQREMAALAAYEALSQRRGTLRGVYFPEGRVKVDVTIYRRPRQKQTDDSAVIEFCKPLWDGIEDAGIVKNDKQCVIGAVRWEPSNAHPRIELTLTQEAA
jgi:hypothetical protein